MCGIAVAINHEKYDLEQVKNSLFRRGPDEQDIYYYNNIALVHTRLAIQDVVAGHQPMHYGPLTIVFNGELYNNLELRKGLKGPFLTHSDTETLLHLYAKHKEKCFKESH